LAWNFRGTFGATLHPRCLRPAFDFFSSTTTRSIDARSSASSRTIGCRTRSSRWGSLAEAGSLLAHRTFDVAVIDQRLGDGIGIDLIPNLAGTPAIVLVRAGEEAEAAPALATGAYGFVVRDAARRYLPLLGPAVNGALARPPRRDDRGSACGRPPARPIRFSAPGFHDVARHHAAAHAAREHDGNAPGARGARRIAGGAGDTPTDQADGRDGDRARRAQ
jgi:hypothetical protein